MAKHPQFECVLRPLEFLGVDRPLLKEPVRARPSGHWRLRAMQPMLLALVCCVSLIQGALAQASGKDAKPENQPPDKTELTMSPAKVDVQPVAHDEEIRKRLQSVLEATKWFVDPQVRVDEGVVFLSGQADTEELKKWAGDLARNTQDVVAVANRIDVTEPSAWDFAATRKGMATLWRDFLRALPYIIFGLFTLVLSAGAGWLAARATRAFFRKRVRAKLLLGVVAWGAGLLVFLAGAYIVLRVSGLTQLALTIVGGTGLVGLAVGIAFRDITENFLSSIFLSVQRPFESGDLIEVVGVTGFVQQLNIRTTVLMTLSGNLVQIPNALVYKSTLRNFSANPNRREDFVVGIGYDDPIDKAQEVARKVLANHPAVLNDPEPWVLADNLDKATVNLRIYFWLNGETHSWLKVRSSVIRLVKRAFQENGISMPDEAREVIFPRGVPVTMLNRESDQTGETRQAHKPDRHRTPDRDKSTTAEDEVSTKAEGGLASEAAEIQEQVRKAQPLDEQENLLQAAPKVRAAE
ncbi:MAG: mechanosensitive ion channel family protein [Alphaproteobacteria bacterium]|nr:mechanosensitive ion channel family protein [Alphaproteobacteria bacterium]